MANSIAVRHRPMAEILEGLHLVRRSPRGVGTLALAVRRPAVDARELMPRAELDPVAGMVGDSWSQRPSSRTVDRSPHPEMQLNVINSRFVELIAGPDRDAWALAGDQLYLDLDLSVETLPAGSRLAIGDRAVIEVTEEPHNGCAKFAARFGRDAHKIVWSEEGKRLRLRGLNARVLVGATIQAGDPVRQLDGGRDVEDVRRTAGPGGPPIGLDH
ncbi:MOSC domain-containing protein [Plantactinospora sp. KBS50]|uniref:MOSC domain-containing protein n=1 Tax=Plantactinospora sp. KBS50 TaxID=2024580 RepID=UPI0018DF16C4|nr:MOSC domain-containing protein [Plantactinospora sp. KBS50]